MVFEQTYHAARQAFRLEAKQVGAVLDSVTLEADGQRAEDGSELTIDFASWGEGERCVVMSSGLHGVEGYIGSATQRLLMASKPPAGRRYLLIHAINPWGMVQFRRVNAFNVDLNRNFLPPGEPYSGSPDHYERLDGLLNPKRSFSQLEFLARSGWQILRHGYEPLKQAIAGGQLDLAGQMLGREYALAGRVIRGDQRGRELGFPTANLEITGRCTPPNGVYAAHAEVDGEHYRAAVNIGLRPTMKDPEPTLHVEAHLLDFDGEIYDRVCALTFVGKLREEKSFDSLDALRAQIEKDVVQARYLFTQL